MGTNRPRNVGRVLLAWLTSTRNIVGCLAGMVGMLLAVLGLLEAPYWPLAVGALYAAGALLAPGRRPDGPALPPPPLDVAELRAAADAQLTTLAAQDAPADLVAAATGVVEALRDLFDRPDLLPAGSTEAFTAERIVTDYLPTTLRTYLGLPRLYRTTRELADGRTPHQVALDQLTLLSDAVRELTAAAARGDAARLLAHGHFLADRFGPDELAPRPASSDNPPRP